MKNSIMQRNHTIQNIYVYVLCFKDISESQRTDKRFLKGSFVMVWNKFFYGEKMKLLLVEICVKIHSYDIEKNLKHTQKKELLNDQELLVDILVGLVRKVPKSAFPPKSPEKKYIL